MVSIAFILSLIFRVFQIVVRGGEKSPQWEGGIRNFTGGGFFLPGEGNLRRSDLMIQS